MKKILSLIACAAIISMLNISALAETSESDLVTTNEESFEADYSVELYASVEEPSSEEAAVVQGIADTDDSAASFVSTEAATEVDGDKTSPDTGVAGVTGIVGVAILAGGTMMLASKRK